MPLPRFSTRFWRLAARFRRRFRPQRHMGLAVRGADQEQGGDEAEEGEAGADEEGGGEAVGEGRGVLGGADLGVGDRGEDGEAEGAADLLGGVDQAAGEALLAVLDAGDGGDRDRDEGEAEADGGEQRGAEDVGEEAAVGGDLAEPEEATGDQRHAGGEDWLEPDFGHQAGGDPGREDDRDRQRQVGEAGLDRAEAEHLLHVERDEIEHREERGADQDPDHVGAGDRPQAEDREGHQRRPRPPLDRDEGDQQQRRGGEDADRLGRAPAGVFGVEQGEDEGREAEGDRRRAGDVEGADLLLGVRFGNQARAQRGGGDPDRDVDPEDPFPADVFGQDPTEQDPGGAAGAGDRAPDAQRFVALGAVAEGGGDDREGGGGEDRGAEALHGAGGDQLAGGARQTAGQRSEGEEHQPEHEDAAAAEQVGKPAAEQEEAAEGEHVGVDQPGQAALAEVECVFDRRQGDVDDRGVQHDHELSRAEQDQGDPALVAGLGGVGHPEEDFIPPSWA